MQGPLRDVRVVVRGDDFASLGPKPALRWLHAELAKAWTIVVRGMLGPPGEKECSRSIRILGRLVTWGVNGLTWEADPRHAELVVQAFHVTGTRVTTPGTKEKAEEAENGDTPLEPEDVGVYRSVAMRAAYLSMTGQTSSTHAENLPKRWQALPSDT